MRAHLSRLKTIALLPLLITLSSCQKGSNYYQMARKDLKTRLINPESMVVVYCDGYELENYYYLRIGIKALNAENKMKYDEFYYHSGSNYVAFDDKDSSLYFLASLTSESHYYIYK